MTHQADGSFTADQLQEMAADLNISPALLQQATQEWQSQQVQPHATNIEPAKQRRWYDQRLIRATLYGFGGIFIFWVLGLPVLGDYMLLMLWIVGLYYLVSYLVVFRKPLQRLIGQAFTRS